MFNSLLVFDCGDGQHCYNIYHLPLPYLIRGSTLYYWCTTTSRLPNSSVEPLFIEHLLELQIAAIFIYELQRSLTKPPYTYLAGYIHSWYYQFGRYLWWYNSYIRLVRTLSLFKNAPFSRH